MVSGLGIELNQLFIQNGSPTKLQFYNLSKLKKMKEQVEAFNEVASRHNTKLQVERER